MCPGKHHAELLRMLGGHCISSGFPPKSISKGNELADSLAVSEHAHDDPSIILRPFDEARLPLRRVFRLRHPEPRVALGSLPPPPAESSLRVFPSVPPPL